MCGRFTLIKTGKEVAAFFGLGDAPEWTPRYNVAPTQAVLAVRLSAGVRSAVPMRWGLATPWGPPGKPLINARAETVTQKPTFRQAFESRRCLVAADGFYEWLTEGREKRPHHFTLRGGGPFAIAALWEAWPGAAGATALLTCAANDLVRPCHDRMPAILPPEAWGDWLDPHSTQAGLLSLLRPYPAEAMAALAVGKAVGSPRNDGPACIEPAGLAGPGTQLLLPGLAE